VGPSNNVLDRGSRSDESICSHKGDKLVMWPFAKLLWSLVKSMYKQMKKLYCTEFMYAVEAQRRR